MPVEAPKVGVVPAPWRLKARGFVVVFWPTGSSRDQLGRGPRPRLGGGAPLLMAVHYLSSKVGPYEELLFIPGRIAFGRRSLYSISHIVVSSEVSVVSGRSNWGIPKILTPMHFTEEDGTRSMRILADENSGPEVTVRPRGPSWPFHSAFLPHTLGQEHEGKLYRTHIRAHGRARLAQLTRLRVGSPFFPEMGLLKPLVALAIDELDMTFSPAETSLWPV